MRFPYLDFDGSNCKNKNPLVKNFFKFAASILWTDATTKSLGSLGCLCKRGQQDTNSKKTIKQLPCLRSKVKLAGMVTNYLHTSPEVLITRSGTEKRDLNKVSKMSKSWPVRVWITDCEGGFRFFKIFCYYSFLLSFETLFGSRLACHFLANL